MRHAAARADAAPKKLTAVRARGTASRAQAGTGRRTPRLGRVLLVEDDADTAVITQSNLAACKLEASVVRTVDEAVAACQSDEFDATLVDVQLPGASGWEFVRWLRRTGRTLPVAIYSVHEDDEAAARATSMGASFLGKSLAPDELAKTVRRMITSRH